MNSTPHSNEQHRTTDLITLAHPLVLFSIAVLLINDHILKVYSPSWLTGKLSDFAGLFFFPILLSAILNLILRNSSLQPRRIALAAFGFTGLWFFLIKSQPLFSHLTETILSGLLSQNAQIICDPTDLIALAMLWPAWKLRSITTKQPGKKNTYLSYVVLIIASIATMATSPKPEFSVRHLIIHENIIYIDEDYSNSGMQPESILYSKDGGNSWIDINVQDLPAQVKESHGKLPQLPVTVCLPDNPEVCYRTGAESIVQSIDGGKTWQISWSIPAGRKKFMQRYRSINSDLGLGPYDLVLLNQNGRQTLVAAAGREGLLIKSGESDWERKGVFGAYPTPYKADDLFNAVLSIFGEYISFTLAAIITSFLHVVINAKKHKTNSFIALMVTLALSCLCFIAFFLDVTNIAIHSTFYNASFLYWGIQILSAISICTSIVLFFIQLFTNTHDGPKGFGVLVVIWIISCTAFNLWAFDVIHVYATSAFIAIFLNGAFFVWLFYRLTQRLLKKRNALPTLYSGKP